MPPKDKTYKVGKDVYTIPETEASSFLKDFPKATEVSSFSIGKDTFDIPVPEVVDFLKENPNAAPLGKPPSKIASAPLPSQKDQTGFAIDPVGTYKPQSVNMADYLMGKPIENGLRPTTTNKAGVNIANKVTPSHKPDVKEAIDNAVIDKNKQFGAVQPDMSFGRDEITKKVKAGELVPDFDSNGNSVLKSKTGLFDSFVNSLNKAAVEKADNANLASLDTDGKIKYLEAKRVIDAQNDNTKAAGAGKLGEFLGENAQLMANTAAGAMTGGALAPELVGASHFGGFLNTVKDFATGGYGNALQKTYNELRQQGMPEKQAMEKAHKEGLVGEAAGITTGTVLSGMPQFKVDNGVVDEFINTMLKSSAKMGVVSGAGTAANEAGEAAVGVHKNAKDVVNAIGESAANGVAVGAAFEVLLNIHKVPSAIYNQATKVVASIPEGIRTEFLNNAVESGQLPKEKADEINSAVSVVRPEEMNKPREVTVAPKEDIPQEEKAFPAIILPENNSKPNIVELGSSEKPTGDVSEPVPTNEIQAKGQENQAGLPDVIVGNRPAESSVAPPVLNLSDSDIDLRMGELEQAGLKNGSKGSEEYNRLKALSQQKEWDRVFNAPLERVREAVDGIMKKEKDKPNGFGSYMEKRDAGETKHVADRYISSKELSDDEIKADFSKALRGNPTTWYADGLLLRESAKEAADRGIDIKDLLGEVEKVYTSEGYNKGTAKKVIAGFLKPIFDKAKSDAPRSVVKDISNEVTAESNPADQPSNIAAKKEVGTNEVATENTQAAGGGEKQPSATEVIAGDQEGAGGITHAANAPRRELTGLGEYKPERKTNNETFEEGRKLLQDKYKGNVDKMLSELEQPDRTASAAENAIMADYGDALDKAIEKDPTNKELRAKYTRFAMVDSIQGTRQGQGLNSRKLRSGGDGSLADYLKDEAESVGVKSEDIPDEAVTELKNEYVEKNDLEKKIKEAYDKGMNDVLEKKAEEEVSKKAKAKPKVESEAKKKEIIQRIKDKWKAAGKDKVMYSTVIPLPIETLNKLRAVAPDVLELSSVYIGDGITKLDDLISKIHETIKEGVPDITKTHIRDILAGAHNEPSQTKNDIASQRVELRKEAKILSDIEKEMKGGATKSKRTPLQKTARIQALQDRLKELKKRNEPNYDMSFISDAEKLAKRKDAVLTKIQKLTKDLRTGKFDAPPPKPIDFKKDKELLAMEDRLFTLEEKVKMRRARQEYDKLNPIQKKLDTMWQILGVKRIIGAAVDFSVPFRQANTITMNPFKYKTTAMAFYNMFRLSFSPRRFKRFQNQIEKSSLGREFLEQGGVFSNPSEIRPEKREEEYINNIFKRVATKIEEGNNKPLKIAVDIVDKVWFSERAAAAFLNTMRLEEFANKKKALERSGHTIQNSPELYKGAAKWIMNNTGRGNLLSALENSHEARMLANNTYFGARLMAAKMNMLNPAYYLKMKPEIRVHAFKDMAGYVGGLGVAAAAVLAAGGKINTNWDDPDFLQARFGDKVYDLTGGSAAYVRVALRFFDALFKNGRDMIKNGKPSSASLSYSRFAGSSLGKTLVTNKLSPNTAYAYHAFTGQSGEYDDNGHRKPFDPLEVVKIYPMWADDAWKGWSEGGFGATFTVFAPNIFGVGYGEYPARLTTGHLGGAGAGGSFGRPKRQSRPSRPDAR